MEYYVLKKREEKDEGEKDEKENKKTLFKFICHDVQDK